MLKTTPAQARLLKRLIKAGPKGLHLPDVHEQTLDALMRRGLAGVDNGRAVLTAPTKQVRHGATVKTVVDLDAVTA